MEEGKVAILYSTHCPMCMAAKLLLAKKGIKYVEEDDIDKMQKLGITHAPMLDMGDGKLIDYKAMMAL